MFGQGAARLFLPDPGNPPPYDVIRDFPDSTSSWPNTVTDLAVEGHCGRLSNVRSWLGTVLTAPDKKRPLYPQQPTFAGRCPLSCLFRPLCPHNRTFKPRWPVCHQFRPLPAPDKLRPLCPGQPTFQPACPLSRRWRPLNPQKQT